MTSGTEVKRPSDAASFELAAVSTVGDAVRVMSAAFRSAGLDTPSLDARRLVEWALELDGMALIRSEARQLSLEELSRLRELASRRLAREPVSRIQGVRAFHGLSLEVGPATLDPRPDTEALVEGVLQLVASGRLGNANAPLRILDLGTGTGAILIALLSCLPTASGVGVDISQDALAVAVRNADRAGVSDRVRFQQSDWCCGVDGRFELVVSNPPYIPSDAIAALEPEVAVYDPREALDGGRDGLAAFRRILAQVPSVLAPGGWIALEVGAGQAAQVSELVEASTIALRFSTPEFWKDLGGIARCVAAEARAP